MDFEMVYSAHFNLVCIFHYLTTNAHNGYDRIDFISPTAPEHVGGIYRNYSIVFVVCICWFNNK